MLFNSFEYLIFFPIVVILYYSIPYKWRWALLLIASYYFYMCWKPEYIFLIMTSTLVDYYAGLQMGKTNEKSKRKKYLHLSLIVNLGLLFGFKYFNFFDHNINDAFQYFNIFYRFPEYNILLPIGISFYTFQTLSYTIDVYRGITKPETHPGKFALYVSFFPQLVSGPIERSNELLPQFHKDIKFSSNNIINGAKLMLWGYFKKVVIADRLATIIYPVFNNPAQNHGIIIIIAAIFLFIRIYCDFSGYIDIAIGSARVMGYKLNINFNRPFISQSIAEFWRRWNITLTSWFRDYFYFSLSYKKNNKIVKSKLRFNLLITFILIGLWHGANWTFIMFGFIHGFYMILDDITKKYRQRFISFIGLYNHKSLLKGINIFITFWLIIFSGFFFTTHPINESFLLIKNALHFENTANSLSIIFKNHEVIFSILLIVFLFTLEYVHAKYNVIKILKKRPLFIRWSVYMFFILFIVVFGVFKNEVFIYFQF